MTTDVTSSTRIKIARPRAVRGRLHCPRCETMLLRDRDAYVRVYLCIGCGYEWVLAGEGYAESGGRHA